MQADKNQGGLRNLMQPHEWSAEKMASISQGVAKQKKIDEGPLGLGNGFAGNVVGGTGSAFLGAGSDLAQFLNLKGVSEPLDEGRQARLEGALTMAPIVGLGAAGGYVSDKNKKAEDKTASKRQAVSTSASLNSLSEQTAQTILQHAPKILNKVYGERKGAEISQPAPIFQEKITASQKGNVTKIESDNGKEYQVGYKIVEASEIQPSHTLTNDWDNLWRAAI